jgi:hypothetical protein
MPAIYVQSYDLSGAEFNTLAVSITQMYFQNEVQRWFKTTDTSIVAPMKLSYKDTEGNVVLEDTFNLEINGPVVTTCQDAVISEPTSPVKELVVAFQTTAAGSWDVFEVPAFGALHVRVESQDICMPAFFIEFYETENGVWMTDEQYGDFIKAKLNVQDLRSKVEFDSNTSMFKATFVSDEIEDLATYLTN